MKFIPTSIDSLLIEIRRGRFYSYARYGDGELLSILGHRGNNADEHHWTEALQADLIKALTSKPTYRVATIQRMLHWEGYRFPEMLAWLEANTDLEWYDQEVFADSLLASIKAGANDPLLELLWDREGFKSVLIVGPEYLTGLKEIFDVRRHVIIPGFDCHSEIRLIEEKITKAFRQLEKPILCLISASMPAAVIIDHLYSDLGGMGWLLDVGSIWNPYLGVSNRSYWTGPAVVKRRTS